MSKYLTSKEVAEELRVTLSTISRWVSRGIIPAEFVRRPTGTNRGSRILIAKEAIEYLLAPPQAKEGRKNQSHQSDVYTQLMARF